MCKNGSVNIQKNGISASDHDRVTGINSYKTGENMWKLLWSREKRNIWDEHHNCLGFLPRGTFWTAEAQIIEFRATGPPSLRNVHGREKEVVQRSSSKFGVWLSLKLHMCRARLHEAGQITSFRGKKRLLGNCELNNYHGLAQGRVRGSASSKQPQWEISLNTEHSVGILEKPCFSVKLI